MHLYCFLAHPFLGLLLGKFDRILCYIYSHGMIWQVKFFAFTIDFNFPATVIQFLSCFFTFHNFCCFISFIVYITPPTAAG